MKAKLLLPLLVVLGLVGCTPATDPVTPEPDSFPVSGESYKLGMHHTEKDAYLYFTGEMSGYYGATTVNLNDYEAGVDVTTTEVEGGWHLSFTVDGTTKYIGAELSGNYKNFKLHDEATTVWTWDETNETMTVELGGEAYFMGTSGSYTTIAMKALSTIADCDVMRLFDENPGGEVIEPTPAGLGEAPEDGETYVLGMSCSGTYYYFTGAMKGYYGESTTTFADGVEITTVAEGSGWYLTFDIAGNTNYINAEVSGTHKNFVFGPEAVSVWTWNSELYTFTTTLGEDTVCIGTYGSYNTFGISTKVNAEDTYLAHLYVTDPAA